MTQSRWKQLEELYYAASEASEEERVRLIEDTLTRDRSLGEELQALLAVSDEESDPISQTIQRAASAVISPETEITSLGPYRLVRLLGRGGMGAVYLAARQDDQYRKEVAIKLIRSEWLSPGLESRFRTERQILAELEHPYIARLLDGGATPSGAPYVVMEYVPGLPVDVFSAREHLPVAARLQLFLKICEAVSYSHRRLIVHRDLKPANILVTPDGTPKLLDFGIAKVLGPDTRQRGTMTAATERLLTPEYAGPEQLLGAPITTSADIYALGIILYELLTGIRPFRADTTSPAELVRQICHEVPRRPSTVTADAPAVPPVARRHLRGDLDTIVLQAIRKEPNRRYASVDALAEDIQRYLNGYPIAARRESWVYVSQKYVRRNWIAVTVAGLLFLGMIAGLLSAMRAQHRVQVSLEHSLRMANNSLFDVQDALQKLPNTLPVRAQLVRATLTQLRELDSQAPASDAVRLEIAVGYEKLADIQYHMGADRLGDSAGAMQSLQRAIAIRRELPGHSSADQQLALASDYSRLADVQQQARSLPEAQRSQTTALGLLQAAVAQSRETLATRRQRAQVQERLGEIATLSGNLPEALRFLELAQAAFREMLRLQPAEASVQQGLLGADLALAGVQLKAGRSQAAIETLNGALARTDRLLRNASQDRTLRVQRASVLNTLGNTYYTTERYAEALPCYQDSAAMIEKLAAENPADMRLRRSTAVHGVNVAMAMDQLGGSDETESRYRAALATFHELLQKDPSDAQARLDLARNQVTFAGMLLKRGHMNEAAELLQAGYDAEKSLAAADPSNVNYRLLTALATEQLGKLAAARAQDCSAGLSFWITAQRTVKELAGKTETGTADRRLAGRIATCQEPHRRRP